MFHNAPKLAAVLTAAALALALTACGGGSDSPAASSTIPASAPFNDADVAFGTEMIPHHAQALLMVDMTRGRSLDPEFEQLTQQILDAQGPEIEEMSGWLKEWDQPVPETQRDHVNADGGHGMGDMGDDEMPGMMSSDDLDELDGAHGMDFEDMWLRMMIEHHEGAIEMAHTEESDGEFPAARDLARQIVTAQEAEITQMKAMLAG